MKNLFIAVMIIPFGLALTAQESLIADIMNVEPVNITFGEEDQKKVDEYDASFSELTTELDADLVKLSEKYAADVTKLIKGFQDVMAKNDGRMINNEKSRVLTSANAYTFTLIKDKKRIIQNMENKANIDIRRLPPPIAKIKTKELKESLETYKENIHTEFEANKKVLKAFKATEHVTKTHVSELPSSSSSTEETEEK